VAKKKLTVLVTNPDTEKIIREVMRIDGQTKERAGNDLLRLAAKIRRIEFVPIVGSVS
jgi:hypothetical protein